MKTLEERIIEKMNMIWTRQEFDSWLPKLREAIREHESEQLNKPVVVLGGANEAAIVPVHIKSNDSTSGKCYTDTPTLVYVVGRLLTTE